MIEIKHPSPLTPDHCDLCRFAALNPEYARRLGFTMPVTDGEQIAAAADAGRLRCAHLGRELLTSQIIFLGLNPQRRHFVCSEDQGTPAGIVCPCKDCGDGICGSFEAGQGDWFQRQ